MAVYLRTAGGERILLDATKAVVVSEGVEYSLEGATLDFYDFRWIVTSGTLGDDRRPARILRVEDLLTNIRVEVPWLYEEADPVAAALAYNGDPAKERRLMAALLAPQPEPAPVRRRGLSRRRGR